jgi:hypothetical protein
VLRLSMVAVLIALAGCAVTGQVAMIAPNGEVFRGTATSALAWDNTAMLVWDKFTVRDDFVVRGGAIECRGEFDPMPGTSTALVNLGCSDGRSGTGRLFRDNAASGSGTIQMNDGSETRLIYGDAAWGI